MLKKTLIAFAALGLAGTVTLTTAPAQAGLLCGAKAMAKEGSWCQKAAERRAARQAKRKAFWAARKKK
ncbi:MAG: hypothetical protein OEM91_06910 [Hyphomicrobiales bacterium]|nr:hypothetical protein [Hyphomicrobiales bacterium]